jgi:hypothetical protein
MFISEKSVLLGFSAILALAGCTSSTSLATPGAKLVVSRITNNGVTDPCKPSALSATQCTPAMSVTLALPKDSTLNGEFIYNLDLQYSSVYDPGEDLYSQTQVAASVPVHFARVGNELQLLSIGSIKYPSDVNHPDELIARFTIVSESDTEFEVTTANSADYLAEQLGTNPANPNAPSNVNLGYLDYWVRSAETAENGSLYLQQSSLQAEDGTITEFMESIFPRDTLKAGSQFQAIKMDPTNPTGGLTGLGARFRFLQGDTVFTGEDKHSFAQHFDLSNRSTIDWYVTANAPDAVLPILKMGVEGWNRYFSKMQGVSRNVMSFKGKLPVGIHIGDPRYNVIGWDDRQVAGAAYESQGSDPESGVQSHSLIYMPAAWLAIGSQYWTVGQYSDGSVGDPTDPTEPTPSASAAPSRLSLRVSCNRDVSEAQAILASGRLSVDEAAIFSEQLLKQVLFHEIGHSLGLAHNFEGSTTFDASKPGTMFSSSIMDYNDYALERSAYGALDSSDGPALEYDRQILSFIYDKGQDIAPSDAAQAVCNDAEADNQTGGVNPICIRYDIGHDPTMEVQRAAARINEATISGDITLQQAIARIPSLYFTPTMLATMTNDDAVQKAVKGFGQALASSESYYVGSSGQSLGGNLRLNVKSLYEFGGAPLPADYDAAAMRERVFAGVLTMADLMAMPAGVKAALDSARDAGLALIATCPDYAHLASSNQSTVMAGLSTQITALYTGWETDPAKGLPALRTKVIASLARQTAVPFYLGTTKDGSLISYESSMVALLTDIVTAANTIKPTSAERLAAATALATYAGRPAFEGAAPVIQKELLQERAMAQSNDAFETAQTMLTTFGWN